MTKTKNLYWIVPAIFSTYVFFSYILLTQFDKYIPDAFINFLALSSYAIFIPLNPLFKPLGLLEGEWWSGPTTMGILVGVIIYDVILFAILKRFTSRES